METITGFVEHIVYRNEENGYTVLNLASNEEDEVTCVGVFQMISEGESLELTGEYTVHPSYGPQFKVQQYSIKAPEDIASIERYLGSGAIKGVGAALAARIVRKFKEDTFRIIEEEPERLAEIKGISERKAQEIAQQTEEKRELRQAMIFLQNYGISLSLAVKIYQTYQLDMYRIIQENPYRMAEDVTGVGFKIADDRLLTSCDVTVFLCKLFTTVDQICLFHIYPFLENVDLSVSAGHIVMMGKSFK